MSFGPTVAERYSQLEALRSASNVAEADRNPDLLDHLDRLQSSGRYLQSLEPFGIFLPPRLVAAMAARRCVIFFGAGVSASAGVPLWWDLLTALGVPADFADEPDLANDPLTAAEVLAHQIGLPDLQSQLARAVNAVHDPSMAHLLLASLDQDVYITTNYDCLFERAWELVHGADTRVVTTDADLLRRLPADGSLSKIDGAPLLFKLHGSARRDDEELILTRGQYRRHYRTNVDMFMQTRKLLFESNTLFLGFGHRDPEITRLVEDVIHDYERSGEGRPERPAFYSLQFDMRERTPEIFAARGIVALQPRAQLQAPQGVDPRTLALVRSLSDMLAASDSDVHAQLDLDQDLADALKALSVELEQALLALRGLADRYAASGTLAAVDQRHAEECGRSLGALAGQGLYVLDSRGETVHTWLPSRLTNGDRRTTSFGLRPYVQQARMYRQDFASAGYPSVFNGNVTVFLCAPIISDRKEHHGLVFAACQPGAWRLPIELRDGIRQRHAGVDISFVLVDSNGVVLVPPNDEFEPEAADVASEPSSANIGYDYNRLRRLSRRDKLIERIWNNIVPLAQDDDATRLGDMQMYSVVAEVPHSRWKLALSVPYPPS